MTRTIPPVRGPLIDVLIVGAGPAGATCATLLARAGVRVALVDGGANGRQRPAEVCAPATLRLIHRLELPAPGDARGARSCRGVLSLWGRADAEFFDYGLYACADATMVDRGAYDAALIDAARSAGAAVVSAGRHSGVDRNGGGWRIASEASAGGTVHAGFLVDASGRVGAAPQATAPRRFSDRLVAFTTWHHGCDHDTDADVLLLEAVSGGWWYVSHDASGGASVVYLTDADLVPRREEERLAHLRTGFDATRLVRTRLRGTPRFEWHNVSDARTSERTLVAGDGWLAIGDAALAIDPLSGDGLRLAIASAEQAAMAIVAHVKEGDSGALARFSSWYQDECTRQSQHRTEAYGPAARRFPHDRFWRRRAGGDQNAAPGAEVQLHYRRCAPS